MVVPFRRVNGLFQMQSHRSMIGHVIFLEGVGLHDSAEEKEGCLE